MNTQGSLLDARYRVIRHLGSGGMASVLLCEDERLGREVAVKRLHADSPEDVAQRFDREARLGASLNHPNLVSVFDTATDDEGVLIVMEFVDGEPLSKKLRRGPLRPEEVRKIVLDLGDALDHAHAQGVIHRDVKPGNVLIREDGMTKLADLGIATASDGTRITRSGIVLGTAAYMAPEQLDGREIGPPADIYALAAIAFESLSGRKPREGSTPMEIAHRMANDGPPDLSEAWPRAPKAAVEVLKRGMAFDPEDRPESAGALARELAEALDQAQAPPTRPTRRLRRSAAAPVAASAAPAAASAGAADDTNGGPVTPTAAPAVRTSRPSRRRPGMLALILAIALIALAAAAIVGAMSGGGDNSSSQGAKPTPAAPKNTDTTNKQEPANKKDEPKQKESAPAPAKDTGKYDAARGAALNSQGFALMNQGDYKQAVRVLKQAVDSFPPGTSDLNYAYALFNYGKSLRLAGQPDKAIPILEQRLQIPNQTETVQHELDLAKQQAGQG